MMRNRNGTGCDTSVLCVAFQQWPWGFRYPTKQEVRRKAQADAQVAAAEQNAVAPHTQRQTGFEAPGEVTSAAAPTMIERAETRAAAAAAARSSKQAIGTPSHFSVDETAQKISQLPRSKVSLGKKSMKTAFSVSDARLLLLVLLLLLSFWKGSAHRRLSSKKNLLQVGKTKKSLQPVEVSAASGFNGDLPSLVASHDAARRKNSDSSRSTLSEEQIGASQTAKLDTEMEESSAELLHSMQTFNMN
jgi:hypothetical protein